MVVLRRLVGKTSKVARAEVVPGAAGGENVG